MTLHVQQLSYSLIITQQFNRHSAKEGLLQQIGYEKAFDFVKQEGSPLSPIIILMLLLLVAQVFTKTSEKEKNSPKKA